MRTGTGTGTGTDWRSHAQPIARLRKASACAATAAPRRYLPLVARVELARLEPRMQKLAELVAVRFLALPPRLLLQHTLFLELPLLMAR